MFVDVGAVELHRVGSGFAFDGVAAVAGVPGEAVVAGAEERDVVAATAVDGIVPVTTVQRLDAGSALQGVVSVLAVERRRNAVRERAVRFVDRDLVVAVAAVDRDLVQRAQPERVCRLTVDDQLEDGRIAGAQPQRKRVVVPRACHRQRSTVNLCLNLVFGFRTCGPRRRCGRYQRGCGDEGDPQTRSLGRVGHGEQAPLDVSEMHACQ